MSHFPIIELNTIKKNKEERRNSSVDYDDPTLNYFCDYFGEPYSTDERYEFVRSAELKNLFKGIADVDFRDGGSIKYYSKEKIEETLKDYYSEVLEELDKNRKVSGWMKFFRLRKKGYEFRDSDAIFYVNGCCFTSMQFFEDSHFYAGKTLFIGQIFDAHS